MAMKYLINYANETYRNQQKFNSKTGIKRGKFDRVIEYGPQNIPHDYIQSHKDIFDIKRGNGLWLWKPYIILDALKKVDDGDYLFYCDSGSYFTKSIDLLIDRMKMDKIDVMPFQIPLTDIQFTSKDCIKGMKCENADFLYEAQREGGFILIKKSSHSMYIIGEYLRYCENLSLLQGGELGEFCIAHREDQSIWSLLTKKEGIKAYRDPSQYAYEYCTYLKWVNAKGKTALASFDDEMLNDKAPVILYLYRKDEMWKLSRRIKKSIGNLKRRILGR